MVNHQPDDEHCVPQKNTLMSWDSWDPGSKARFIPDFFADVGSVGSYLPFGHLTVCPVAPTLPTL